MADLLWENGEIVRLVESAVYHQLLDEHLQDNFQDLLTAIASQAKAVVATYTQTQLRVALGLKVAAPNKSMLALLDAVVQGDEAMESAAGSGPRRDSKSERR